MKLVLVSCLVLCGTASADSLLGPAKSKNPAEEWKQQLRAAPTYHGTFTRETKEGGKITMKTKGTIASDPAHRKLHVHTSSMMGGGKATHDHYDRDVDLVIDGKGVELGGGSGASKHTSKLPLSPQFSPDAPFGDVPNVDAGFTYAGDLRQTVLDCLDAPLEPTKVAHEWRAAATTEQAQARMKARHDPAQTMHSPPNVCADVVFEAGPDNTLKGLRIAYPADSLHSASVDDLRFELATGFE